MQGQQCRNNNAGIGRVRFGVRAIDFLLGLLFWGLAG
ncbi:MAG: hypothetical protein ACI87E_004762, partial [Mariniblastus sp.]